MGHRGQSTGQHRVRARTQSPGPLGTALPALHSESQDAVTGRIDRKHGVRAMVGDKPECHWGHKVMSEEKESQDTSGRGVVTATQTTVLRAQDFWAF